MTALNTPPSKAGLVEPSGRNSSVWINWFYNLYEKLNGILTGTGVPAVSWATYLGAIEGGTGTTTLGELTGLDTSLFNELLFVYTDIAVTVSSGASNILIQPGSEATYTFTSDGLRARIDTTPAAYCNAWTSNTGLLIASPDSTFSDTPFFGTFNMCRMKDSDTWIIGGLQGRTNGSNPSVAQASGQIAFSGEVDRIQAITTGAGSPGTFYSGRIDVYGR